MPVPPPRISRRRGAGAAGGGRRRFGGGSAPGRRRPRAQGRVCGRGGAGPAPGIRTVSRRWRDRDPAPFRAADTEVGAANARLLERCRPAGPPEGAGLGARGSRTCEGAGRTAGRQAQSQIAEDIFGAEEVEAKRYPDGGMRSQIRRWVKSPRPGGRRLAQWSTKCFRAQLTSILSRLRSWGLWGRSAAMITRTAHYGASGEARNGARAVLQ